MSTSSSPVTGVIFMYLVHLVPGYLVLYHTDSTDRVFSSVLIWVVQECPLDFCTTDSTLGPTTAGPTPSTSILSLVWTTVPGYSTGRWHDHSRAFYGSTRYGLGPTTVYIMILLCRYARTWKIQHSSVPWCPTW